MMRTLSCLTIALACGCTAAENVSRATVVTEMRVGREAREALRASQVLLDRSTETVAAVGTQVGLVVDETRDTLVAANVALRSAAHAADRLGANLALTPYLALAALVLSGVSIYLHRRPK